MNELEVQLYLMCLASRQPQPEGSKDADAAKYWACNAVRYLRGEKENATTHQIETMFRDVQDIVAASPLAKRKP